MKPCKKRLLLRLTTLALAGSLLTATAFSAAAANEITRLPDVTPEMSSASYWADLQQDSRSVLLTPEEILAYNRETAATEGTHVTDLKNAAETFNGLEFNAEVLSSAESDAKYYFGWTYLGRETKATWPEYEELIRNCGDPNAAETGNVRYGVAVNRALLKVFPSDTPIWDDPADPDFDYESLSAVAVNDPLLIYTTSADGKYYRVCTEDCSGWISAEDVAICADKTEWLSAWDLPSERLLVVYGNKIYTDASNSYPDTAQRMLTQGTALELVTELQPDQLVNNRSPFHNYVVYLPVRRADGSYEKQMALIPETAKVSVGYLPLTAENIAMVALNHLGDTYGWGGMLNVEDCSGMVRTVYSCFGMTIGRNGNWQWNANMEKIDLSNTSLEEKCLILDQLPLGSALCFPGHEMIYLGKVNGKYYVISTASSMLSPATGKRLRTRDVMINTLDVCRPNGKTWLQELNKAFTPAYAKLTGRDYAFPTAPWYHDGVAYVLKNGLMSAQSDGTFGLSEAASRGALVTALWKLCGSPVVDYILSFYDVSEDSDNAEAIRWAAAEGIFTGDADGFFRPAAALTREEAAGMLYRYARKNGIDVTAGNVTAGKETNLLGYRDAVRIHESAMEAMQWAFGSGILQATPAGELAPQGVLTRAQLADLLLRANLPMQNS